MGRNTVREAVRSLVQMGKLEARQGDGTHVRSRSGVGAAFARTLRHRELLKVELADTTGAEPRGKQT
ncbi:hypothetical protein [Streptomyces sp. KM273126]|uniref:hypothetical protein n=1 Tax=Streptomyces sp. KM273126 TaxID=2545247 RepID=UPI0026A0D8B9